ncbi:heme NO-binding domain-containing protein [Paracoccus benzoatiresistens]|uniref:Heme NO-binding domain-containing protein n=1 Tax=Paracoccus benzoatiresistens TaxID=2997341 RepID=A0ABT4J548_9RHOB|nr:heme NO-binding domain-containing protein [Paracoccus sp. EF6]MCZ0962207.1 heme NO-binding domain-containing protein [Paracoccus sp. EF6]
MHDLVNRAIEKFLHAESVHEVEAGLLPPGLMLRNAAQQLGKPVDELVEDLGAWLVRQDEIWRLLRFCGSDFLDFLLRLDELPERIRLITDDVEVPEIALSRGADGLVWVTIAAGSPVWTALLSGLLRAMADDYGTLCVITRSKEGICIDVSDLAFAEARTFRLSARAGQA